MQMKEVKFLEGNEMSFFCRMSGKYLTFKPYGKQQVPEATADELVKSGRFEYVEPAKTEEGHQEKKGRMKK